MHPLKHAAGAIAGVIILFATHSAHAQEFRAGGGVGFPLEPSAFTDLYTLGFHGGLELGSAFGSEERGHFALAGYHHRFALDTGAAREQNPLIDEVSGGTYALTEILAQLRYDLSGGAIRPYALGGLGLGMSDATDLTVRVGNDEKTTKVDSELDPAATFGFGVTLRVGDAVNLFGQLRLAIVFTEEENTMLVPITIGIGF